MSVYIQIFEPIQKSRPDIDKNIKVFQDFRSSSKNFTNILIHIFQDLGSINHHLIFLPIKEDLLNCHFQSGPQVNAL